MQSAEWAVAFRDGIVMGLGFRVGCEASRAGAMLSRGESPRWSAYSLGATTVRLETCFSIRLCCRSYTS